jgi:hypothetical protein
MAFEGAGEAMPNKLSGIIADLLVDFTGVRASAPGNEDAGVSLFTLVRTLGDIKTLPCSSGYCSSVNSQVKLILSPKQRAKPAASRTRTCTNAAVCIASG